MKHDEKSNKCFFSFKELIKTDTGLPNLPTMMEHVINLVKLWRVLNEIRDMFGDAIYVNSAYRTPQVNDAILGNPRSYHLQGLAADIRPDYVPSDEYQDELNRLVKVIKSSGIKLKEFIIYPNFIHIAI